jgi:NAD(P)-dependent dehydrogenase (short-subunit alcohol dehydrogenase family)
MDLELKGRRALVTGATRGIGRAIAERLAGEGCALAICARDGDEVARTADELRAHGVTVHGGAVDVTDAPSLARFVAEVGEALGGLELLVANAGGSAGGERLEDAEAHDWRTTFELNVVHAAVVARAAVPLMRAAGGGAMVFIASISGLRPQPRGSTPRRRRPRSTSPPRSAASSARTASASTRSAPARSCSRAAAGTIAAGTTPRRSSAGCARSSRSGGSARPRRSPT